MATGSSQATLPSRELWVKDLSALYEALYPVRAKYRGFGLQIGVDLDDIKNIESNNKDSGNCLLEILSSHLKKKPVLTCNDIDKALRSRTVDEHTLADYFQSKFECKSFPDPQKKQIEIKKESSKKSRAAQPTESESSLKMSKKESERIKGNVESEERAEYYVESDDESKATSDESENNQKAVKSAEVERQVHERDEPKSRRAKKRARKKEKIQCACEQLVSERVVKLRISKKETERSKRIEYVESDNESKSDGSDNMQFAEVERQVCERDGSEDESESENIQSVGVERQVHERDEPKSKKPKKRAGKKERTEKNKCASEQPVSESAIQLRMGKKESKRSKRINSDDELKSDENENIQKGEEIERQVHERDDTKSKRAKKRARKKNKNQCASEQPEPDEYKEDERKQMKGKEKLKILSETAISPQSGAESDQKRKKSGKKSEKIAPEIMSTDSENESSYVCKEKEMLLSKTGKVRKCAAYSEVKHQPQSAKIREVKNEARKKEKIPEKEGSTKKQHSVLHRKTAMALESDKDTGEQPSHKSKKILEEEETESEESFSESTSDESETESPKHKEKVKPKSPTDKEELYHDSDEEIEKVRAKDKKKVPQKFKVATAKCSPLSERLVKEEQYKQKKGKRSVDMKEQERQSELQAKARRGKPHSRVKERERVKKTDSEIKAKRLVVHFSEQASDESETDCESEESNSGNDSSEDGEGKSSDEEEKRETDEEPSTAPSEEEVKKKKKKKEKSVCHEEEKAKKEGFEEERKLMERRVSKAVVKQSKYDSPQGGRRCDETHTKKVKGKRESEAASLKYVSPGDDEQSDPGYSRRDQEEHDIQQKRRKKKKQRRESSMSPTAIGSSSPSTSQEEKKKQPVSKKQGHRKKHVRKMKEKRERMKRGKEKAACSSGRGDSSPECDMTKNQCKSDIRELVGIFKHFFGKLCRAVFDPVGIAVELQIKGLISKAMMKDMMLSPESQQSKIIHFIDALDEMIKYCPDRLFIIIEVMLENEALQETAREILRETGTQCLLCELHLVLESKTVPCR